MTARELDLDLPSGRVHAQQWGDDGELVVCVHGLSANMHAFDVLAERLARPGRRLVAVDLRGRGRSEVTPPGTYGLPAHARDVLDAATLLGAERLDLIGWSMGALVGMEVAAATPGRLRRLGLIDHAGAVDPSALEAVRAGLARLDAVVDDPQAYVDAIRAAGAAVPWEEMWDRFYRYELGEADGRWTPTTDRAACTEDLDSGLSDEARSLWPALTMPTVLVRASVPLAGGFVVPEAERDALAAALPDVRVVEVERNHFGVMTHEATAEALEALLSAPE